MQNAYMLVVDNVTERQQTLLTLLKRLRASRPDLPEPRICATPTEAIAFSSEHECPIVFTAVNLPGLNGFAMIEQIRRQKHDTNFILLADRKEYIMQALMLKLRLSGSIMGMPDLNGVQDELNNLWFPLSGSAANLQ